jgi:hypothetical protein
MRKMKHITTASPVRSGNTMGSRARSHDGLRRAACSMALVLGTLAASVALAAAAPSSKHAAAPLQPHGTLQFFTDADAFQTALGVPPGITSETFDGGAQVGPFPTLCGEPMSSASNDVCFTPGQIVPGFEIRSTSGSGIIEFPPRFLGPGQVTRAVGATTFVDSTIVTFNPSIDAVASEVYGGLAATAVDVELFDASGTSIGMTTIAPGATRDIPEFFGAISPTPIAKVLFTGQNDAGELIDNLRFRVTGVPLPPGVAKSFTPAAIVAGTTSTLTITLGNRSQPGAATLSAALSDNLPSGLVIASTPNAATTCSGGSVDASAGGSVVTLAAGAQIPASSSCTITVDVTAATAGAYANTIPAGALQTNVGNNGGAANATLLVSTGAQDTFPPAENFDEVFAPQLPNGWVTSTMTGSNDWTTVGTAADTAPNAAFAQERSFVSDFTLDTPVFTPVDRQTVTFRHRFNLERRFDGAVLEISINGGAFADITAAGGSFISGGYSYIIFDGSSSPLVDRPTWTGNSQGFMTTIAALPAAAVGQPTQLRFRTADDASQVADGASGWWIDSIALGVASPPVATTSPASLSFAVDPDATASETIDIANDAGRDPLTFTVETRNASNDHPRLVPYSRLSKRTLELDAKLGAPRAAASLGSKSLGATPRAASPWMPQGGLEFMHDDGTAETALGVGTPSPDSTEQGAVWMNRYGASDALVIHSISVFWPVGDGDLSGLQANLVVYYDADADGDATNAVRVGTDQLVTIGVTGAFETYQTNFSIPAAGDVYVGFVDQWALAGGFTPRLFPAALDESSSLDMSYISSASVPPADIVHLGNNDINGTILEVEQGQLNGNFMIRASATGGGGGGACTGPIVNWLSATPSSGTVNGGSSASVTVTASPAAANLAPGSYSAQLCITTNDPTRAVIAIPVSMTVNGDVPATACNGGADELFCDGFDSTQGGGSIVSGTINMPVAENADGSSFDFATGSYHPYNGSIHSDDINLYELIGGQDGDGMYVYWYGDAVPPAFTNLVGGVVDAAGGAVFSVLHAGDTVGPASAVSGGSTLMSNWIGGADGYVGIAFYNESTGAVNYGYLHLTTTGPLGFPAQAVEWAYDNSGAAITIP